MGQLSDEVKRMAEMKFKIQGIDNELKDLKKDLKVQASKVTEMMQVGDVQNIKVESKHGSYTAFQFNVIRARVSDNDAFEAWCAKDGGLGSVAFKMWSAQKLTSAVREIMQEEGKQLPYGIDVDEFTEVRLRKE